MNNLSALINQWHWLITCFSFTTLSWNMPAMHNHVTEFTWLTLCIYVPHLYVLVEEKRARFLLSFSQVLLRWEVDFEFGSRSKIPRLRYILSMLLLRAFRKDYISGLQFLRFQLFSDDLKELTLKNEQREAGRKETVKIRTSVLEARLD